MPKWLTFLSFGRQAPSLWLLRPLSLLTAFILATRAPEIEPDAYRITAYVGLSLVLLWCFIWLVWHFRVRWQQR